MAQHTNYWSCSKFANWLRGTNKLRCGTSLEWKQWNRASKEAHPFRYWLVEEGLDYLQDVWCYIPEKICKFATTPIITHINPLCYVTP